MRRQQHKDDDKKQGKSRQTRTCSQNIRYYQPNCEKGIHIIWQPIEDTQPTTTWRPLYLWGIVHNSKPPREYQNISHIQHYRTNNQQYPNIQPKPNTGSIPVNVRSSKHPFLSVHHQGSHQNSHPRNSNCKKRQLFLFTSSSQTASPFLLDRTKLHTYTLFQFLFPSHCPQRWWLQCMPEYWNYLNIHHDSNYTK